MDALYLFACRVRCLRFGDRGAYRELLSALEHGEPDARLVAETFVAEIRTKLLWQTGDIEMRTRATEGRQETCLE